MHYTKMHETSTGKCIAQDWMIQWFKYKNIKEELEYPQIKDNLLPIIEN
jgi:hypothetical protein